MKSLTEFFTRHVSSIILPLLPWMILGAGLFLTYELQNFAHKKAQKELQARFDFQVNELVSNIKDRLENYEQALAGTKSLFISSVSVERDEFRNFVEGLDLANHYPGIQGVGFSQLIPPQNLKAHISKIRQEGFPEYIVHPEGKRDTYTSIIYLEPFDWRNQRAFGYDMYSEPVRRAAMERARDENRAIMSGRVTLVQETEEGKQPGFLMYVPVYRNGPPHNTLAERRENLIGWVYAPFRMHNLMNGVAGIHFDEIGSLLSFEIFDGDTPSAASLMYSFNTGNGTLSGRPPIFYSVKRIDFEGHPQWTLSVRSLPKFETELEKDDARYITITGITGSMLMFIIVWLLVRGHDRALAKARVMTREFMESEVHTKRLNRALRLLSDCNMTLVRAKDEKRLLSDICRLIVDEGGYRLAWVGFAAQDETKTVRPVAQAGFEQGYLDSVNVTWADTERRRGPTGTAIRTGNTDINQDYLNNPRMLPWRKAALERGYQSSIALPLIERGEILGALTIYAPDPNAFGPDEVKLLEELANDLAYGIETLRSRSEHKIAEEQLEFMAHHDHLTQLPNRLLLRDRFDQAIATAERNRSKVSMLFLDMDNFKQVNDTLGHSHGDQLLVRAVEKLHGIIRGSDTISRQGGDEFAVLLNDIHDQDTISGIAQKIIESFAEPIEIEGSMINATFSIGVSVFPDDGTEFDTLLKKADTAMYHAKESGRNTYRFYTTQMNRDASEQLHLQGMLHSALQNGEFLLHYQPQIDVSCSTITGVEALLRWQHPEMGMVAPDKFIRLAERSGLIIPIGEWVLNEACHQAKTWLDKGHPLVMAVNLSALQFKRGNLLEIVSSALALSGLPPRLLELELTESILLEDQENAMKTLHELKRVGVKLSIDDFGTGYSSLSYLKQLAVDKLKIDQSFVRNLVSAPDDAAIVKAIIQLGHTLKLSIIAEGVETEAQLAFLRENGCDEIQGYFFSRPLPADEVVKKFANESP